MTKTSASTYFNPVWIDYSSTSTLTGWTSTSVKSIQYMIIGKLMIFKFNIVGVTSTGVNTATLTMPFASSSFADLNTPIKTITATTTAVGNALVSAGSSTVNLYPTAANGNWQSGAGSVKTAYGTLMVTLS